MVARNLERRLEQLVEGLAGRVFKGVVQPGELAGRLLREADLAMGEGPAGPVAPNYFTVTTVASAQGEEAADLEAELSRFLEDAAAQRGWRLEGPAMVRLVLSEDHTGRPLVTVATVPADRPPWAFLDSSASRHGLTHNRSLVGRNQQCDVVMQRPEVSRVHALIYREGGQTWIEDRGSANGLYVNGMAVERGELVSGTAVGFGPVTTTFRIL